MAVTSTGRAPMVCNACHKRKRACNKELPRCRYCVKKRRACVYSNPSAGKVSTLPIKGQSGAVDERLQLALPIFERIGPNATPSLRASGIQLGALPALLVNDEQLTNDQVIYRQVCHTIQMTGRSFEQVVDRYFNGLKTWPAIVCPSLFTDTLVQRNRISPPADFSILLLAMCLVTERPSIEGSSSLMCPQALYITTKMMFAHVQTFLQTSTTLVQAGLVIAGFEYASSRANTAYISVGTCVTMGRALGIDKACKMDDIQSCDGSRRLQALERVNVWWGVVVMERIILCETTYPLQPLMMEYPSTGSCLPRDFIADHPLTLVDIAISKDGFINNFGRFAQAVLFVEQVVQIVRLPPGDPARLGGMKQVNASLHDFLDLVMNEVSWTWLVNCGAISASLRALFILHEEAQLDWKQPGFVDEEWKHQSQFALDSATKMMAEVARTLTTSAGTGNRLNADIFPPTGPFNVVSTIKHLRSKANDTPGWDVATDLSAALALDRVTRIRWHFVD